MGPDGKWSQQVSINLTPNFFSKPSFRPQTHSPSRDSDSGRMGLETLGKQTGDWKIWEREREGKGADGQNLSKFERLKWKSIGDFGGLVGEKKREKKASGQNLSWVGGGLVSWSFFF